MSEQQFFRVVATVTFTGEWFIPVDEAIRTPESAEQWLRANLDEEPENFIEPMNSYIRPSETWLADETGERIEAVPF